MFRDLRAQTERVFRFSAGQSHAGILFEPYVGYGTGHLKTLATGGSETKYQSSEAQGGLRLGLRHRGLWIAGEGELGFSGKLKPDSGDSEDLTETTMYASLGYDFMTRVRLYAGYGLSESLQRKNSGGVKTTYSGGTAWKAGLGYWLHPHLCINLEYSSHDYKKIKTDTYDGDLSLGSLDSVKADAVRLNFSFPLNFL